MTIRHIFIHAAIISLFFFSYICGPSQKAKADGIVIGIDLGTTYSCVGIFKNGRVEIIPNEFGNRITPSFVAFTDEEKLVGEAAKNQAFMNPKRSVYVIKRLIGREFKDKELQRDLKWLPYDVINKEGKPYVQIKTQGGITRQLSPEEVSSMILVKMKQIAENYLGREVKYAVITVPAYFNDSQRQSTKNAGEIAGLEVLRIINEPTAAAIAFGMDKKQGEKNIIVFDLGGGTFDVSLLMIDNGVFEVVATAGDTHLGGEDFDQKITEHFVKVFKKKHDKDIKSDARAMQKLKSEVEKAKRDLSTVLTSKISIENLIDGIDFEETITRARFEELCSELFKKTLLPVQQVLEDASMDKSKIDEIVLVGGSTRIPKVKELLKEFFDGKEPNNSINPDEAVAYGAAVQGGILGGETSEDTKDILLIDVTPLTFGIETVGGVMNSIIPRGTTIPTKKTKIYTTSSDYQKQVETRIFEGERPLTKDNHLLGEFMLSGIPSAPKGVPQIEVTFAIDENSILTVTAKDKGSGRKEGLTITNDQGRLSKEQIDKMIRDSERYAQQDKKVRERLEAKRALEDYINSMKSTLGDGGVNLSQRLSRSEISTIEDNLKDQQDWIESNENADKEDFEFHLKELQDVINPIISKIYKTHGSHGGRGDGDDDIDGDL